MKPKKLLVAGGSGLDEAARDQDLLRWLRSKATSARRFGSICTGAFLLGAVGLLDGKKATTHWKWAAELAARCQHATIDPDPADAPAIRQRHPDGIESHASQT